MKLPNIQTIRRELEKGGFNCGLVCGVGGMERVKQLLVVKLPNIQTISREPEKVGTTPMNMGIAETTFRPHSLTC